ncbi:MAG: LVIVD repeat-containing protein, partial [Eubacterium sp.]
MGGNRAYISEDEAVADKATSLLTDDEYLYSADEGVLTIYSLQDKANPSPISSIDGLGNTRDMDFTTDGNFIVVNSRENGTYFVSIEDKYNPEIVSCYATLELATGLYVYGDYVFLCSRYFGVEIVDISDIYNPVYVSQVSKVNEEYYDCCVSDGYLYVSVWAQMKVEIYDLSDIYNPVSVSTILVDGECGGITVSEGVLYVACGYHGRNPYSNNAAPGYGMGNGMEIYDVSTPENPQWLSSVKIDGRYRNSAFDHWKVKVAGNYAYFTNIYNGVYIYDISDLRAPKRIDNVIIYIDKTSSNYKKITLGAAILPYDTADHAQGAVSSIAITNGHLYISDTSTGIYVYEKDFVSNELTNYGLLTGYKKNVDVPEVVGYKTTVYDCDTSVYSAVKSGENIYVACGDRGIQIIDKNLNYVSTTETKGAVRDLLLVDDILYAAESNAGLGIYLVNGKDISLIGYYTLDYYNQCFSKLEVCYDTNTLMVQAGWNRIILLDISEKSNLSLINEITTGSMYYGNLAVGTATSSVLTYCDNLGVYCYGLSDGE